MPEGTDIVTGTVAHGDDETSAATTLAKRVDVILAAHAREKCHVVIQMVQGIDETATPLAIAIVAWED